MRTKQSNVSYKPDEEVTFPVFHFACVCLLCRHAALLFPSVVSTMSNSSSSSLLSCARILYRPLIWDLVISLLLVSVGHFGGEFLSVLPGLYLAVSAVATVASICLPVSRVLSFAALCDLLLHVNRNRLCVCWPQCVYVSDSSDIAIWRSIRNVKPLRLWKCLRKLLMNVCARKQCASLWVYVSSISQCHWSPHLFLRNSSAVRPSGICLFLHLHERHEILSSNSQMVHLELCSSICVISHLQSWREEHSLGYVALHWICGLNLQTDETDLGLASCHEDISNNYLSPS